MEHFTDTLKGHIMNRLLLLTTSSLILTACATTHPGSGAALLYDLPKTNASASLTMTLQKCPTATDELEIEASLSIAANACLLYTSPSPRDRG